MWDLIVSVPDHCLSFYFADALPDVAYEILSLTLFDFSWLSSDKLVYF